MWYNVQLEFWKFNCTNSTFGMSAGLCHEQNPDILA